MAKNLIDRTRFLEAVGRVRSVLKAPDAPFKSVVVVVGGGSDRTTAQAVSLFLTGWQLTSTLIAITESGVHLVASQQKSASFFRSETRPIPPLRPVHLWRSPF